LPQEEPRKKERSLVVDAIFLHILADTLGSVGVILSSILIHLYGWMWADPVCSIFIALLILISVYPLLLRSGGILLMRTPEELDEKLPGCRERLSRVKGLLDFKQPHVWLLNGSNFFGSIEITVDATADSLSIARQVRQIFSQIGVRNMAVDVVV
jgi:zinc transporter 5/7